MNEIGKSFSSFNVPDSQLFKDKLIFWAAQFSYFAFLDSNSIQGKYDQYDYILGVDSLDFISNEQNPNEYTHWLKNEFAFGYFAYEMQLNKELRTKSTVNFETSFLFKPRYIVFSKKGKVYINRNILESLEIKDAIESIVIDDSTIVKADFTCNVSKIEYLKNIKLIQEKIRQGSFYEINYCIEFLAYSEMFDPLSTWVAINNVAKSPMSALIKTNEKWALSFSPERFIAKRGSQLISQPIKGTAKRDLSDPKRDEVLRASLKSSKKELAENQMIVDLVRNDLTFYAKMGSIKVEELCEVYSFPFVHQLISTISATLQEEKDSIKALFLAMPAASMTGAPKKEVVKNIAQLEETGRGLYAGSIGYFDSEGDYDFNVVIRTLLYDTTSRQVCLNVGGAITLMSDAEQEYEECMTKAEGILKFFQ